MSELEISEPAPWGGQRKSPGGWPRRKPNFSSEKRGKNPGVSLLDKTAFSPTRQFWENPTKALVEEGQKLAVSKPSVAEKKSKGWGGKAPTKLKKRGSKSQVTKVFISRGGVCPLPQIAFALPGGHKKTKTLLWHSLGKVVTRSKETWGVWAYGWSQHGATSDRDLIITRKT